jgi:3-deoxy-manno-octulosonate cytidylyltransferase (CMP-KDO synthetase)
VVLAVIPARYASTRLPGKALADIGGVPMVVRVWERARLAPGVDRVLVATDDPRIADAVTTFGAEVVLTGPCASGTDRVAEAVRGLDADVVVNVQGDEPFLDPADVARVAAAVSAETPIATGGCPLLAEVDAPSRVKVVCNSAGEALYFSRLPIPLGGPWTLHVGLYAFAAPTLQALAALPPSGLEGSERLEQLRWMEAGHRLRVVPVHGPTLSVDTPADLVAARLRFAAEAQSRAEAASSLARVASRRPRR